MHRLLLFYQKTGRTRGLRQNIRCCSKNILIDLDIRFKLLKRKKLVREFFITKKCFYLCCKCNKFMKNNRARERDIILHRCFGHFKNHIIKHCQSQRYKRFTSSSLLKCHQELGLQAESRYEHEGLSISIPFAHDWSKAS